MVQCKRRHVLVETTGQIKRLFGTIIEKQNFQNEVQDLEACTSSMVYVEFKRTMLQSMALVARTVDECRPDDDAKVRLGDLSRWLSNSSDIHSEEAAKLTMKVVGAIQDKFQGSTPTAEEVVIYLRGEIRKMAIYWFFEFDGEFIRNNPERYFDLTNCPIATDDVIPGFNFNGRLSCRRGAKECKIGTLLRNNWAIVQSILEAFERLSVRSKERDQGAIDGITLARHLVFGKGSPPLYSLGQKCCWKLGDIIIGLECPDECQYIHSYDCHFGVISSSLKKTMIPVKLGRQVRRRSRTI